MKVDPRSGTSGGDGTSIGRRFKQLAVAYHGASGFSDGTTGAVFLPDGGIVSTSR